MIKLFEQYNEYNQVKDWLEEMGIKYYTINDDLTVDVDGPVEITYKELTEIPIQFGRVQSTFNCCHNELTTLKGCPKYVGGSFNCSFNNLTTLEHCPKYIVIDLDCKNNQLKTLMYHPEEIGWVIWIIHNDLPFEIRVFEPKNDIRIVFKYQEEYGIWNTDGGFNTRRWDIFLKDYEDGILN